MNAEFSLPGTIKSEKNTGTEFYSSIKCPYVINIIMQLLPERASISSHQTEGVDHKGHHNVEDDVSAEGRHS
jgi:hypothetical protein